MQAFFKLFENVHEQVGVSPLQYSMCQNTARKAIKISLIDIILTST